MDLHQLAPRDGGIIRAALYHLGQRDAARRGELVVDGDVLCRLTLCPQCSGDGVLTEPLVHPEPSTPGDEQPTMDTFENYLQRHRPWCSGIHDQFGACIPRRSPGPTMGPDYWNENLQGPRPDPNQPGVGGRPEPGPHPFDRAGSHPDNPCNRCGHPEGHPLHERQPDPHQPDRLLLPIVCLAPGCWRVVPSEGETCEHHDADGVRCPACGSIVFPWTAERHVRWHEDVEQRRKSRGADRCYPMTPTLADLSRPTEPDPSDPGPAQEWVTRALEAGYAMIQALGGREVVRQRYAVSPKEPLLYSAVAFIDATSARSQT